MTWKEFFTCPISALIEHARVLLSVWIIRVLGVEDAVAIAVAQEIEEKFPVEAISRIEGTNSQAIDAADTATAEVELLRAEIRKLSEELSNLRRACGFK